LAFYRETDAAYDIEYSKSLGLSVDKVDFGDPDKPVTTVEDFARDLGSFIGKCLSKNVPGIYILDSLDALSDEAEMERDISEGTYGAAKAKKMSELLRTVARKLERTRILLIIVSQVRDKIGVTFGERHSRSGGRALDFYASQIIYLSHVETLKKKIAKIERPYGIIVRAKIKKNKVSMPGRETDFYFEYSYGVNDVTTSIEWLKKIDRLNAITNLGYDEYIKSVKAMPNEEFKSEQRLLADAVKKCWVEIEEMFAPKRSKYD